MASDHSEDHPEYLYYMPNQALLYFEHDESEWFLNPKGDHAENQFSNRLFKFISKFEEAGIPQPLNPELNSERQIHPVRFTLPGSRRHLTVAHVKWPPGTNIAKVVATFNELLYKATQTNIEKAQTSATASRESATSFTLMDEERRAGVLKRVVLNWYMGASYHTGLGTHGPGLPPRPVINNDRLNGLKFVFSKDAEDKVTTMSSAGSAPVDVYVLDTIPSQVRIETAWKKWRNKTWSSFEEILKKLNQNDPLVYRTNKATYHYAPKTFFDDLESHDPDSHSPVLRDRSMDGPEPEEADQTPQAASQTTPPPGTVPVTVAPPAGTDHLYTRYDTADHGLFIAGIIHNIAPNAHIHVIQVLNDAGVGSFFTLIQGFAKVIQLKNPKHKTIINCSLTLAFPTENHQGYNIEPSDYSLHEFLQMAEPALGAVRIDRSEARQIARANRAHVRDLMSQAVKDTETLFEDASEVVKDTSVLLSAAGNDSINDGTGRLAKPARYLATKLFSTGVGARQKNQLIEASYSNRADSPHGEGFMVFGGDYHYPPELVYDKKHGIVDYKDSGQGIIGLYTGDFTVNPGVMFENQNGFAEWAGTSFAAPIFAGYIAKVCHQCNMTPDNAIILMRDPVFSVHRKADDPYWFIAVEQEVGD